MTRILFVFVLCIALNCAARAATQPIELRDGDRVVLLGSGLLERSQRYGYVETVLTRLKPKQEILFRNLAWSGDTVNRDSWVYSLSHPNHEVRREQLYKVVTEQRPTVIVVGYGAMEAFEGKAGRHSWRRDLQAMLDRLGETGARLILFTSPPQEVVKNPSATTYNRELAAYMTIMREIAATRGLPVIDLASELVRYRADHPDEQLTVNGLHFSETGYRVLASLLVKAIGWQALPWSVTVDSQSRQVHTSSARVGEVILDGERLSFSLTDYQLPEPRPKSLALDIEPERLLKITRLAEGRYTLYIDGVEILTTSAAEFAAGVPWQTGPAYDRAEQLRHAIVEKNRLFFARWRPENEVYLRGFRQGEQGRNTVELPLFDPLIVKQEQKIARLRQPTTNHYHLIPAAPSSGRGPAKIPDPNPAIELASFEMADGFEATLFASEPLVTNPICMNWDSRGRLWVATSRIYPQLKPGEQAHDEIVVLEDTDGDGRADNSTVFADGLLVPTGIVPGDGGIYVANSTELIHLSDTNGDGRADRTRVVVSGFGTEDTHQILHAFRWGPGGRLYFNQSVLIHSHVETPAGVRRLAAGGVWEFDPDKNTLDIYTRGMVNPWGNRFDKWGQSFATDGAYGEGINYIWPGAAFYWAAGVSRILTGLNPGQPKECGLEIVSGRHFPDDWQGRFVTADFRAHRIVTFKLSENKSGYFSEQKEDLIRSDHPAFRPVDISMGPDGALYLCDWYNPIIQHGEVDFRDPRRDHQHGRIWRISAVDRATLENPGLADAEIPELLRGLKAPEQWTRDNARRELGIRDRDRVVTELREWVDHLDSQDPDFDHHRLEALWVFETVDVVPAEYLKTLLHTADHRVRAATVRVLSHTVDLIPDALTLLEEALIDDHPRVRLEAINALRSVGTLSAFETTLRALDHPMDELIDYALWVTVRKLESIWLPAFEQGQLSFGGDPGRVAFVLAASEKPSLLGPLVSRFRANTLETEIRDKVAELIAAAGSPADLQLLLDRSLSEPDPARRAAWLDHLATAARDRGLQPNGNLTAVSGLLRTEPAAVSLAGLWKVAMARPFLNELATKAQTPARLRRAAIWALADLGGEESQKTLSDLNSAEQSATVRTDAVAALAEIDLNMAARQAIKVLPTLGASDAGIVFNAFLDKTNGPQALKEHLYGTKLPTAIAALGANLAAPQGDRTADLVEALTIAGGSMVTRANLSQQEWTELLVEVVARGDASKGEAVFRRTSLSCVKCHAVGGAGGKVGPDLMSLGASAPLDYIVESLVHPNRKIKEGYETTLVMLDDGQVLTGTVLGEVGKQLLMRNAENVVVKVPRQKVDDQVTQPVSLMPPGLTDTLDRDDFIDLVKFLSVIGKAPGFQVPTTETVRVWQTLQTSERLVSFPSPAGDHGGTWLPVSSRVAGSLPLDELTPVVVNGAERYLVRFQVEVHKPGRVAWRVDTTAPADIWIDGKPVAGPTITASLDTGIHWVELAIEARGSADRISISRKDVPGSEAQSSFKLE